MSRLVAFGCSYTYGHGLEDCRYDGVKYTDDELIKHPSQLAWPKLAADMLGMQCVNHSLCGVGNKFTAKRIAEFEFRPGDIAVIMWTIFTRHCVIMDDGNVVHLGAWQLDVEKTNTVENRISCSYFTDAYTEANSIFENLAYINFADSVLKHSGVKHVHCSIGSQYHDIELMPYLFERGHHWNRVKPALLFDDTRGRAEDGHPNEQSHSAFADTLVEYIQTNSLTH